MPKRTLPPREKKKVRHLDLFSGIGGFTLAAKAVWGGAHETVAFCDNDNFCQNVLRKHWPDVPVYGDIRELTADRLVADADLGRCGSKRMGVVAERGETPFGNDAHGRRSAPIVDLLTGGFPCQPFSNAGRKRGDKDDRYLWPEMLRVIRETKPAWVVGENVAGIVRMALDQVCSDLEGEGYAVQPFVVPACAVGAPHRRDRVWIVARRGVPEPAALPQDAPGVGRRGGSDGDTSGDDGKIQTKGCGPCGGSDARHSVREGLEGYAGHGDKQAGRKESSGSASPASFDRGEWNRDWREVALATCHDGVDDGLPKRVVVLPDGSRISQSRWRREALKAYGNAIVPQVAEEILRAIKAEVERDRCG